MTIKLTLWTFWTFTSYTYQKWKTNSHTLIQFLQLCNMSTNYVKKSLTLMRRWNLGQKIHENNTRKITTVPVNLTCLRTVALTAFQPWEPGKFNISAQYCYVANIVMLQTLSIYYINVWKGCIMGKHMIFFLTNRSANIIDKSLIIVLNHDYCSVRDKYKRISWNVYLI